MERNRRRDGRKGFDMVYDYMMQVKETWRKERRARKMNEQRSGRRDQSITIRWPRDEGVNR